MEHATSLQDLPVLVLQNVRWVSGSFEIHLSVAMSDQLLFVDNFFFQDYNI